MLDLSTLRLRAATSKDHSILHSIYASTREEELMMAGFSEEAAKVFVDMQFNAFQLTYPVTNEEREKALVDLENDGRERYEDLIIEVGGKPIGRLILWRTGDEIRGADIALLTKFRNQGVGSEILKRMIKESNKKKKPIRIQVIKWNRAKRLYDRFGFQVTGETDTHYQMERPVGELEDQLN